MLLIAQLPQVLLEQVLLPVLVLVRQRLS